MPANARPRVLLLIPHLGGGGAERVTALLARNLPADKYELHLGLITQAQTNEALPVSVHVHVLCSLVAATLARDIHAGLERISLEHAAADGLADVTSESQRATPGASPPGRPCSFERQRRGGHDLDADHRA